MTCPIRAKGSLRSQLTSSATRWNSVEWALVWGFGHFDAIKVKLYSKTLEVDSSCGIIPKVCSWRTLRMTRDEVLMLIISCAVIVEVATMFGYLRRIPRSFLLLGSFAALVLGSLLTVVEGLLWTGLFNVLEHLSLMAGAILLALWCALVFGAGKQEEP